MLISSSKAVTKALNCGASVLEITQNGNVVGLGINETIVRHNGNGWYDALKIDEAIGHHNISITLTFGGI